MASFFSSRFGKNVWLTNHAKKSMVKREIDDATLEYVIELGDVRHTDNSNLWLYCRIEGREDNLLCEAVVEKESIVVKTVMINRELEDEA